MLKSTARTSEEVPVVVALMSLLVPKSIITLLLPELVTPDTFLSLFTATVNSFAVRPVPRFFLVSTEIPTVVKLLVPLMLSTVTFVPLPRLFCAPLSKYTPFDSLPV